MGNQTKIDFSVLLRSPETQSYDECILMQDILLRHRDEALMWLRCNTPMMAGVFNSAERLKKSHETEDELNKIVLILLARVLVANQ